MPLLRDETDYIHTSRKRLRGHRKDAQVHGGTAAREVKVCRTTPKSGTYIVNGQLRLKYVP